jgi:hypothetical protein
MTKVFFSTDTEIWCDGWQNLDERFPEAFRRYVYGPTKNGDFGLNYQLKVLNDHGLKGTFFVEPLFALRFGLDPLSEIVSIILDAGQEIQLHMHTEWIDEVKENPLFPEIREKRQHLAYFNFEQQKRLIAEGKRLLVAAGAPTPVAFRAGSFAMNRDTLRALVANDIFIDSSYNSLKADDFQGRISDELLLFQPLQVDGVTEYPLTVYQDRPNHYRPAAVCACSTSELTGLLNHAAQENWDSVVILSHNFELLTPSRTHSDSIVKRRFNKLCHFLEHAQDRLPTTFFRELTPGEVTPEQPELYRSSVLQTGWRYVEQALSKAQQVIAARSRQPLAPANSTMNE